MSPIRFILASSACPYVELTSSFGQIQVPLSGIDWTREIALVVDMGEKRTGGYGVAVKDVSVTAPNRIDLVLEVTEPAPGSLVTQVMTHPYAVCPVSRGPLQPGPVTITATDGRRLLAQQVVIL